MPATSASLSEYGPAMASTDELQHWEGFRKQRFLEELRAWIRHQPIWCRTISSAWDFWPEGILNAANTAKANLIVMGTNQGAPPGVAAHPSHAHRAPS
jgi:hypothetical protein